MEKPASYRCGYRLPIKAAEHRLGVQASRCCSHKDYRTWAGSALALAYLREAGWDEGQAGRRVVSALRRVSSRLGNTLAVCQRCYVHPRVVEAYRRGELHERVRARTPRGLREEEAALLRVLRQGT